MKSKRHAAPPKNSRSRWLIGAAVVVGLASAAFYFSGERAAAPVPKRAGVSPVIPPEAAVFAQYAGAESCRECHQAAHASWSASHHGLAERPPAAALDAAAFESARTFTHGTQTSETRTRDEKGTTATRVL